MTKNRAGRGRPKLPEGEAREIFSLRMTKRERERIEIAAKASGEKASRWARNYLLSLAAEGSRSRVKKAQQTPCLCSCRS